MSEALRYLRLVGATGPEIRSANFDGKPHIVVPVVALVGDIVIHASNAPDPELVRGAELEHSTPEWEGRPVVGDHPTIDGQSVSANLPEILESKSFGRIFHPRYENGRLLVEAWLDPERAAKVGHDAVRVIERCQAGEPVEVSVGAYVEVVPTSGVAGGREYKGEWARIGADHLAMLPENATGACSMADGCGAPRIARRYLVTATGLTAADDLKSAKPASPEPPSNIHVRGGDLSLLTKEQSMKKDGILKRWAQRIASKLESPDALLEAIRAADGESDSDVRSALDRALYDTEPAYQGIYDVFPSGSAQLADPHVVYACSPAGEWTLYRRGFTLGADGAVTLAESKEPVEVETTYKPVTTATAAGAVTDPKSEPAVAASGCGCQYNNPSAASAKEEAMSKLAERVKALIANPKSPFDSTDETLLAAKSEAQIKQLEEAFGEKPATAPETKPEATAPAAPADPKPDTVELSKEEYQTLRSIADREKAREQVRKDELVAALKGAQSRIPETKLKAMSVEQLEDLAAIVPAADYSGYGFPRTAESDDTTPPDPYDLKGLEAKRTGKEAN